MYHKDTEYIAFYMRGKYYSSSDCGTCI